MKKFSIIVLGIFVLSTILAACATPTQAPTPEATEEPEAPVVEEPTEEPVVTEEAPAPTEEAAAPVEPEPDVDPTGQKVVFWHVWGTGTPSEAMVEIVDQFNQTNEWDITVEPVDQGRYSDLEDAMNAAIQSGDVPNLAVGYSNALANWYQVGVLADLNPYMNDSFFGFTEEEKADFYQAALAAPVLADDTMVGFPISQSANVLFYNQTWAQELGFENPPATAEEFKEQACAAAEANATDDDPDNDGTGGYVLYAGASDVASWVFAFGGDIKGEGGEGYAFNTPVVKDVALFLKDLQDNGCAFQTESYPNPEFATRKALFTVSSTAGLPYQIEAFAAEGASSEDEWGFIAFPGKDGGKAVNAFGQTIGMVNSTPESNMAAWLFLKYFSSPEVQAQWINSSAYYPTRMSVNPLLEEYVAANPIWQDGLDLLEFGMSEPAKPSWATVRRAVGDTFTAIIGSPEDQVDTLLSELDAAAAEAVEETDM